MTITKSEQEATDFDWFGTDDDGHVGHFTTAGFKYLPKSVSSSAEDLLYITDYFDHVAPIEGTHTVDPEINKEWNGEEQEARYLESFAAMADRGLYSYDIDTYVRPGLAYCRVAIPLNPIMLNDMPDKVRKIIERTALRGISFDKFSRIDYENTLSS